MQTDVQSLYRLLPQVGNYLDAPDGQDLLRRWPRAVVLSALRTVLGRLRKGIAEGLITEDVLQRRLLSIREEIAEEIRSGQRTALSPVINATGVILQTNLGRAPLSARAIERIRAVARGYCNLEFDLATGERGRRGAHVEDMLVQLLEGGREPVRRRAALVVNNCAAATFLALNSLADGGEVIVSRGELVEIGGGFRVPDILRKSGATLREVGTTNRTHIEDYAAAITAETRLILRVHQSNFEVVGFTARPELEELVKLGAAAGVPVFEDQGTGCVARLEEYGIARQSSLRESAASGAALVAASGDKLLGGPQCGILFGDERIIDRLRANPLYRALRVDKLTYAALEATLEAYLADEAESIPAIGMLSLSAEAIRARCEEAVREIAQERVKAEVVATESVVGGGTTPGLTLPSFAIALEVVGCSAEEVAARLRDQELPVIGRIQDGRVLLDLRTVFEEQDATLVEALTGVAADAKCGDPSLRSG